MKGFRIAPMGVTSRRRRYRFACVTCGIALSLLAIGRAAQQAPPEEAKSWSTAEDHQHLMQQLGISALRPGPSGNEQAPNHANYDESLANPFPESLPNAVSLSPRSSLLGSLQQSRHRAR